MNQPVAPDSTLRSPAAIRLRTAFDRSRHSMLIADDQRRWVTANAAACDLLQIARDDVPWRAMDDFTAPSERTRLEQQWNAFLAGEVAAGWFQLHVPGVGPLPVEFSAVANVLPARHLSIFISPADESNERARGPLPHEAAWRPVRVQIDDRVELTARERQIMTLVACGLTSGEMAARLSLSPETVKSHAQNGMAKLGAHTRAHAVAVALMTGQITWET